MKLFKTAGLVSVVGVSDFQTALAWYGKWLGEPDEMPAENIAEWLVAEYAWLQLDGSKTPGSDAVVITVENIASCREALIAAGIEAGEITDWEVVLTCDLKDPDGNRISLAQIVA